MSDIKTDIKQQVKKQKQTKQPKPIEPQEHKTFIIYNPLKPLPKTINKELKTNKKQIVEIFYNDANEILEHLQNDDFIYDFKNDVQHIYNLYNNYYNTVKADLEGSETDDLEGSETEQVCKTNNKTQSLKTFIHDQIKQLKLDKKQNIPNEFDEIEQDVHEILTKYQNPNKTCLFTEYFQHKLMNDVFKEGDKDKPVKESHQKEQVKNLIKFKSFNELMNIYKNTETTVIINTLSKDFNIDEIKDIINYGTSYKHIWLVVDYLTYKLINVEGVEIVKNKSYVIKF